MDLRLREVVRHDAFWPMHLGSLKAHRRSRRRICPRRDRRKAAPADTPRRRTPPRTAAERSQPRDQTRVAGTLHALEVPGMDVLLGSGSGWLAATSWSASPNGARAGFTSGQGRSEVGCRREGHCRRGVEAHRLQPEPGVHLLPTVGTWPDLSEHSAAARLTRPPLLTSSRLPRRSAPRRAPAPAGALLPCSHRLAHRGDAAAAVFAGVYTPRAGHRRCSRLLHDQRPGLSLWAMCTTF